MSCPAWEDCNKKGCIENSMCTGGEYWTEYWKNRVAAAKSPPPNAKNERDPRRNDREPQRVRHWKDRSACVKKGDWCDKKEACSVLNQCIVTLSRVIANPGLLNALKGPHSIVGIIRILKKYDPKPMRSYYLHQKK